MSRNFLAKTGFLALTLGAIATISVLNACSSSAQNQAQTPDATATDAGTKQMDHGNMGGMNHGDMKQGGMMDHSMMALGPADAEFDLRFIDSMIPHHEGAVVMAKEAQQKSKRPEIQKLAADIIKAQDTEIAQMKQWRTTWYPKASSTPIAWHSKMGHSMAMSEDQMKAMRMDMDLGSADANFDKRFIDAMIPHHKGAVVMAQDALNKSKRLEIQKLAKDIISSQKAEIKQMQQWKQAWYKQ
jgi:uncharacterized protein (DUF305 family)